MKDYTDLKKEQLLKLLKKKNIPTSSSESKDDLIKLLLKSEKPETNKKVKVSKPKSTGKKIVKKKIIKTPKKVSVKAIKPAKIAKPQKPSKPAFAQKVEPSGPPPFVFKEDYIKDDVQKFHALPDYKFLKQLNYEIPESYNYHKLSLFIVDPYWLYCFWEIKKEVIDELTKKYGNNVINPNNLFLRIYDISFIIFDGTNAHKVWEIKVNGFKGNWFTNVNKPESNFMAKIGFKDKAKNFIEVLASNVVKTPRDKMSDNIVQKWATVDIDKPISMEMKDWVKQHIQYRYEISFISSLPGSIFGSMSFLTTKKGQ